MPRTKRNKKTDLTKVIKNRSSNRTHLTERVHEFLNEFKRIYIIQYTNETSIAFKNLRKQCSPSRILLGKHTLIRNVFKSSQHTNLSEFVQLLVGRTFLLFTNDQNEFVDDLFKKNLSNCSDAVTGVQCQNDVVVEAGSYPSAHPKQLAIMIRQGAEDIFMCDKKIHVKQSFVLCKKGEIANREQSKLMKMLGLKMTNSNPMKIVGSYEKETGDIRIF